MYKYGKVWSRSSFLHNLEFTGRHTPYLAHTQNTDEPAHFHGIFFMMINHSGRSNWHAHKKKHKHDKHLSWWWMHKYAGLKTHTGIVAFFLNAEFHKKPIQTYKHAHTQTSWAVTNEHACLMANSNTSALFWQFFCDSLANIAWEETHLKKRKQHQKKEKCKRWKIDSVAKFSCAHLRCTNRQD